MEGDYFEFYASMRYILRVQKPNKNYISYFYITVIKHQDQGDIEKMFIWPRSFREVAGLRHSMTDMVAGPEAECFLLDPPAQIREQRNDIVV